MNKFSFMLQMMGFVMILTGKTEDDQLNTSYTR